MIDRDQWFWALSLVLLKDEQFHVTELSLDKNREVFLGEHQQPLPEMILIRNSGRHFQLIRLQAVDFVWGNTISQDIRFFADLAPVLRKRLKAKKLQILNIYLFSHEHAILADREHELQTVEDGKVDMQTQYLFSTPGLILSNKLPVGFDGLLAKLRDWNVDEQNLQSNLDQYVNNVDLLHLKQAVVHEQKRRETQFKRIFHYGKPILTYFFLIFNLLIFGYMEWTASTSDPETLIRFGAKWAPNILTGEYWRFLSAMFIHIGFLHIAVNSFALYFLGSFVERLYGSMRFLWIYLFSGFCGTLASFAFTPQLAAGASGAIFGCFGALLYFGLRYRNLFFRTVGMDVIMILLINIGIGLAFPVIDHYGHIGGLVGGFLAACMVNLPLNRQVLDRLLASAAAVVSVVFLLVFGFQSASQSPYFYLYQAEVEINNENYEAAQKKLEEAIAKGQANSFVYFQLGTIDNHLEQFAKAEQNLNRAVQLGGRQAELFFALSYAQLQQDKYDEGRTNLLNALEIDPDFMEAYYNLAYLYVQLERYDEAMTVLTQAQDRGLESDELTEMYESIKEYLSEQQSP